MFDLVSIVTSLPSMPLFPYVVAGCAFTGIWCLFWRWMF